jgi:hypothetical protein
MLRLHFLDWVTIDWDEDLYRAYAQDLLRGKMLYRDIWDHKPPGIFYLFAVIQALHPSITFFRLVGIACSVADGLLLYAIARRLWNPQAGCAAFLAWTVATCPHWGAESNSELFFTFFTLASVCFFVKAIDGLFPPVGATLCGRPSVQQRQTHVGGHAGPPLPSLRKVEEIRRSPLVAPASGRPGMERTDKKCRPEAGAIISSHVPGPMAGASVPAPLMLVAGFLAGLAFQIKPVTLADFAAILAAVFITLPAVRMRVIVWALIGFLVPSVLVLAYFGFHGLAREWFYAAYWYNLFYVSEPIPETLSYGPRNLLEVLIENGPFFVTAAGGLALLLVREDGKRRWLFALWVLFAFFSVALGLKFLKHYFVQWLAPLSLLAGYGLYQTKGPRLRLLNITMSALFYGWVASVTVFQGWDLVERVKNWRGDGLVYYDVSYRTAVFLNQKLQTGSVYVWRSPSLAIYFLSGRRPTTRFLFWRHLTRRPIMPWMEQEWKKQMLETPPDVIINSDSYDLPYSSVAFMQQFIQQHYRPYRKLDRLTIYQLRR